MGVAERENAPFWGDSTACKERETPHMYELSISSKIE
jgi:hypothetical protein